MYILSNEIYFPPVSEAHESGILAFGGDLSTERLLLAYNSGIFPWYEECEPITWYAPEYRMVLPLSVYKPKKSVRNLINRNIFNCSINQDFESVILNCQQIKRAGQNGTWITDEIIEAYSNLHKLGKALSVEVWQDGELVGGLYGIVVGRIFCGESMFSIVSNASKIGFDFLVNYLKSKDFVLVDGQVYNEYLEQLGFFETPREAFMEILETYR
ncbi:leucyl/phenylalanyl-tRNA--protein transferase [Paenimyroides tangerinum]|uniref:Leucyl/phenylalanyl-tRNA--protein transferase n=1 Tax=Paenimyroides tangerinum TaxID=2488728 RepID=A0A3P3WD44_9FLAO|nr:leucyl/phenylalanyl-tRNA--protein transferase [Paenimyroides tangerinum]RRJ88942.1 leucyl/phenylalanyl-tRNA--protein transferase [Paenimyroides tangerinum]RRJ92318.1 leucyl/phenylalanyl-tRNA--protein transferase [Paenimyroides tangerinum]